MTALEALRAEYDRTVTELHRTEQALDIALKGGASYVDGLIQTDYGNVFVGGPELDAIFERARVRIEAGTV